jgi:hypothetical protein
MRDIVARRAQGEQFSRPTSFVWEPRSSADRPMTMGGRVIPRSLGALLGAVLTGTLLSGCGSPSPAQDRSTSPGAADSGIHGRTVAAPGCPIQPADGPCPEHPTAAHVVVTVAGSKDVVESLDSGTDGTFDVDLAPGRYSLKATADPGGATPQTRVRSVTVTPDHYTRLVITFDSGIRVPMPMHPY